MEVAMYSKLLQGLNDSGLQPFVRSVEVPKIWGVR